MSNSQATPWTRVDAALAVVLGWLVPGAGHLYLGRRRKALALFVLIMGTYLGGQGLAKFKCVFYRRSPTLKSQLWFYGQAGAGLPTALFTLTSEGKTEPEEAELRFTLRPGFGIGTLWTTVAGLLNLLAVVDVYDIYYRRKHPKRDKKAAETT